MGLINCKLIREEILNEVKSQLAELKGTPRLCIVTIGNDDASKVYVRNKIKTAKELGIDVKHLQLDDDICQEEAEQIIEAICNRSTNHAVMLQLPIPKHLDKDKLINVISQHKDVDGLTDVNMGNSLLGFPRPKSLLILNIFELERYLFAIISTS